MSFKRKIKRSTKGKIAIIFIVGFLAGFLTVNIALSSLETAINISVVYSSEKASWMTIAYTDFLDKWNEEHPDIPIKIEMQPYGSSDSIISILNGEIFPTIWSPASSIWMSFLNAKWAALTGAEEDIVDIDNATKVIFSPIVIATWEAFNFTYNIKGFSDVRSLTINPVVDVKMAHTDPRLSNSGYLTTIMALSAGSGVSSENLTMSDLVNSNNQQWLTEFESGAIYYGKSTGFLSRYMKTQGPNGLNIAFLYENLVRDISSTSVGGKVIAVYPEEGVMYSDHPFCLLNADWITPEQRMVAEEFLKYLQKTDTVESAMQYAFRPINSSITLDPEVFNYENNGITYNITVPEQFTPTDEEVLLSIPDLWLLCKATS